MGSTILIVVIVAVACAGFAVVGAILGSRMEEKRLGAGAVESDMRGGLSASVLGAWLGIVPFLIFVAILIGIVVTNPAHREDPSGTGSSTAAGH
jgi:hypothetical protein